MLIKSSIKHELLKCQENQLQLETFILRLVDSAAYFSNHSNPKSSDRKEVLETLETKFVGGDFN